MKKILILILFAGFFACKPKSKISTEPQVGPALTGTECVDTDNPFAVAWLDRAIDRHNPTQVVKYKKKDGWMYLFRGIPSAYLYDCQGHFVCETQNNHDPCHDDHLAVLGRGKIIWEGEGVWD